MQLKLAFLNNVGLIAHKSNQSWYYGPSKYQNQCNQHLARHQISHKVACTILGPWDWPWATSTPVLLSMAENNYTRTTPISPTIECAHSTGGGGGGVRGKWLLDSTKLSNFAVARSPFKCHGGSLPFRGAGVITPAPQRARFQKGFPPATCNKTGLHLFHFYWLKHWFELSHFACCVSIAIDTSHCCGEIKLITIYTVHISGTNNSQKVFLR